MGEHDRLARDALFDEGFALLSQGDYDKGINLLRVASGADHLEAGLSDQKYNPATGISWLSQIAQAAEGKSGSNGQFTLSDNGADPAALVFMGAEAEFKGFIERRTGESPDYRIVGYKNHLGQAINYYRRAEQCNFAVATERLESLRLRLGSEDFRLAEQSFNESRDRSEERLSDQIHRMLGSSRPKQNLSTRVEVRGLQQRNLQFNPTVRLFWDGRRIGKVKLNGGRFEFEIKHDGVLRIKSGYGTVDFPVLAEGSPKVFMAWDRTVQELVVSDGPITERY